METGSRISVCRCFWKEVTVSQFYFWFAFSQLRSFGKVEIYLRAKFWVDIPIHFWFLNYTSAIMELFRFRFHVCVTIDMSFCTCLPTFVQSGRKLVGNCGRQLWIYYGIAIFKMTAVCRVELPQGNCTADHPRSADKGLCFILKFRLDVSVLRFCFWFEIAY